MSKYLDDTRTQSLITEIKTRLSGKADKTTTYTKTETDDKIAASISSVYKPGGSKTFSTLPELSQNVLGYVYNISEAFTTTADFVEGAGKNYPAGTNVVVIEETTGVYKFDVLAGFVDLSGYMLKTDMVAITTEELNAMWGD